MTIDQMLANAVDEAHGAARRLDEPGMAAAARLARLDALDGHLCAARARVADARALIIADAAVATSTRQAALDLDLSLAAVAKACARVRTLARDVEAGRWPA